jgi:hypothetical protein
MRPKIKTPPVAEPAAIPEVGVETEETAMKRARRRKGFEATLSTGLLTSKKTNRLTTLGG